MCITGSYKWMPEPKRNQTKPTSGFVSFDICIIKPNTIRNKNERRWKKALTSHELATREEVYSYSDV